MEMINRSCHEWSTTLTPWDAIVDLAKQRWGQKWVLIEMANMALALFPRKAGFEKGEFFDTTISLCSRARYARLKPQALSWWTERFDEVKTWKISYG